MATRGPRVGRRVPAAGAVALAAVLAGALAPPVSQAQPAPPSETDLGRAKDLYASAEAAMADGRYADAVRDYGASYELSKDPALFFKIGHANEKAGKCDVALVYYARYLRDGHPIEQFAATTRDRIEACGGVPEPATGRGHSPGVATGSAAPDAAAGSAVGSAGSAAATGSAATGSDATSSNATGSDGAATGSNAGAASAIPTLSSQRKAAWIITGGTLALVTLGGVLAYAASSSENDVRDLYTGFGNLPPAFDAATRKRYNDLIDEGRRYQHLSWAAFGLAGAAAAGAALLFVLDDHAETAQPARVTPIVTPSSAGVAVRVWP